MHRRLIGKRASLSRWLIQVIFNRSLYIIRFPLIYYAYIQNQPQYQGFEHAEPCVLRHCLRTSPFYGFCCLHKGNMVFWMSILKVMDFIFQNFLFCMENFLFCLSIIEATLLKLPVSKICILSSSILVNTFLKYMGL